MCAILQQFRLCFLKWICMIFEVWHCKLKRRKQQKDRKPYLGLVFSDSSPGPLCSLCSSRSCPQSQRGKRSLAALWGSFWTNCPGSPCHLSPSSVHSSALSLPSLGCTWPPCSVYLLGPAACHPLFFLCQMGKKEITENTVHQIVRTVWVLISKQHLSAGHSQLSNVWWNTSVAWPRSPVMTDQTPLANDHGLLSETQQ